MSERLKELKRTLEKVYSEEAEFARGLNPEVAALTAEQNSQLDRHESTIKSTKRLIEAEERSQELESLRVQASRENEEALRSKGGTLTAEAIERKLLTMYVRGQNFDTAGLKSDELKVLKLVKERALERSQGTDVAAEGGFLTFETFSNRIIQSLKEYGGLVDAVDVITTSNGNPINFSTNDDTSAKATPLAERVAAGASELVFGRKTWGAEKYTTGVFTVSNELIYDSIIDIEAHIASLCVDRFGRGINHYGTIGTGTGQATGIAKLAVGYTQTNLASDTAISYNELVNLVHSVNKAYRNGASFMFSDDFERAVRLVKDSTGQPIWSMGDMAKAQPTTLLGYKITTNTDMAALAAAGNAVVCSFGNHKAAYTLRQVGYVPFKKSEHVAFASDEVAFVGFIRFDGKPRDIAAIKQLKTSAV